MNFTKVTKVLKTVEVEEKELIRPSNVYHTSDKYPLNEVQRIIQDRLNAAGLQIIDFRVPISGEYFMGNGLSVQTLSSAFAHLLGPRFILGPARTVKSVWE